MLGVDTSKIAPRRRPGREAQRRPGVAAAAATAANAPTASASRCRGTRVAIQSGPGTGRSKGGTSRSRVRPAVLPGLGKHLKGHGGHSGRGGGGGEDRCFQYSGGRRPYNRGWTPRSKRRNLIYGSDGEGAVPLIL
jgi:hypothetical protein